MKIIGLGKITKKNGVVTKRIIVAEFTEKEADMITGIVGKPHIAGRYRPGREVNIAAIYNKVERINRNEAKIKKAMLEVKSNADDITNSIPL